MAVIVENGGSNGNGGSGTVTIREQIRVLWSSSASVAVKISATAQLLTSNGITTLSAINSMLSTAGVATTYWPRIQSAAGVSSGGGGGTTPSATTIMKVYSNFGGEDIVENLSRRVTTGMWTGDTGSLETFFTSSAQSGSSGDWYWDVYDKVTSDTTTQKQFAVAYGNITGGGYPTIAVLNTSKEPTKAIYSQYRNMLLDPEDVYFTFGGGWDSTQIFVINLQRARLKQKMDAGNWELTLINGSDTVKLIDDSGDKFDQNVSQGGRIYNVVSGSLNVGSTSTIKTQAANEASGGYGLFYPDRGFIILNPRALEAGLGDFVSTGSSSTVIANNHGALYTMIKDGASFTARNEEVVTSTHYFVRVKNKDYNLSNNPTYYTSSDGTLNVSTFIGDPHTYLTTVGLYNDSNELLAVAKVSTPLLKSFDREALIKVKLDY